MRRTRDSPPVHLQSRQPPANSQSPYPSPCPCSKSIGPRRARCLPVPLSSKARVHLLSPARDDPNIAHHACPEQREGEVVGETEPKASAKPRRCDTKRAPLIPKTGPQNCPNKTAQTRGSTKTVCQVSLLKCDKMCQLNRSARPLPNLTRIPNWGSLPDHSVS